MSNEPYFPGLEGVIAGETAISTIQGGLQYYGYAIEELAEEATFEETAYLLLEGELPTEEQLADFRALLAESYELPIPILNFLREIPLHVGTMSVLRSGISMLSHFDPLAEDQSPGAILEKGRRLLAQIPTLIAARIQFLQGKELLPANPELGLAGNLLWMLTGHDVTPTEERAMDVSLILYAEHEFNASTFAARVVSSTLSDYHSSITAAVGALKGSLHGGANERVMEVLDEVGDPSRAEAWVRQALDAKRKIMGFGHRVYKEGDPRAEILKRHCRQLAAQRGNLDLEVMADTIEEVVREEKQLPPNLDWPSARLYYYLGLDPDLFTPLFVASRIAGWTAHVMEQLGNNRLIRPRARYVGPTPRELIPLANR